MAEGVEPVTPGIIGLFEFVAEHEGAIESDLIDKGLRLRQVGVEDFNCEDILTVIRYAGEGTALYRELNPDGWMWSHTDYLLAMVYDKLAEHNWMISKDGSKGIKRPKPIPRPGLVDENNETKQITGKPVTIEEMERMLGNDAPFKLHAV